MNPLIIRPKGLRGEDGYRTFSIRIREETVAKLDALAHESGRSRNELIGLLLGFGLDNCMIQDGKEP